MDDELYERFSGRYESVPSGCWEWRGAITADGYATITKSGRTQYAHRLAYEHFVAPIPGGLVIDHLCRVRHCVNPEHLEAITNRQNVQRGYWAVPPATHCEAGHEFTAENTVLRVSGTRKCRTCRNTYARERARAQVATRRRGA